MEMITTIDENGCVISIEFIYRNKHGDKITIVREKKEES